MEKKCEYCDCCPFFQSTLVDMPATEALTKKKYCHDDFKSCARYIVTIEVGAEHVADSLFPNNNEQAERVITRVRASQ
ncbi:hypothetical protein M3P05_07765 [Sansalvadorimonas sp. 2012CJ34-2]|uniref:Uncharacterized protein n=1 Tax=Parendozoicomonas callyspongiae TaxID=2942213 RepID=A0ABT0PF39_9GAMM|nr:hypothetical protein [Sansalvadorimonas sp. 2012CJ34-2]MCL6269836.1 hypothetical protein [Sansalvadorimonas sp. 2012CJ34-2]